MPTPVAKGIIITVSALVAAGIAVYESPQFRQWVDNSRRKIAIALHNLGDEIQPQPRTVSPSRQDISMTEDMGPEAEERRRLAREDLQRRRRMLEENRKRRNSAQLGSFDALVDDNGALLRTDSPELSTSTGIGSLANSTAVELPASQVVQRSARQTDPSTSANEGEGSSAAPNPDRLHLTIPPKSPSDTLVEFTPTSDVPDASFSMPTLEHSDTSSQTVDSAEIIYEHPDAHRNGTGRDLRSPFSDLSELSPVNYGQHERPSTPSTAGSYSHIYESALEGSSDGTLSDFEMDRASGIATPASWSEIGSVISNDDTQHARL